MPNSQYKKCFQIQALRAHNRYRGLHGCLPLVLNKILIDSAQKWSEELSKDPKLFDSYNSASCVGENIFVTGAEFINGAVPVDVWYNEQIHYDFVSTKGFLRAGHFTQLIWRNTEKMGVGIARSGRTTVVVAHYFPPGNILEFDVPECSTTDSSSGSTSEYSTADELCRSDASSSSSSSKRQPSGSQCKCSKRRKSCSKPKKSRKRS